MTVNNIEFQLMKMSDNEWQWRTMKDNELFWMTLHNIAWQNPEVQTDRKSEWLTLLDLERPALLIMRGNVNVD